MFRPPGADEPQGAEGARINMAGAHLGKAVTHGDRRDRNAGLGGIAPYACATTCPKEMIGCAAHSCGVAARNRIAGAG